MAAKKTTKIVKCKPIKKYSHQAICGACGCVHTYQSREKHARETTWCSQCVYTVKVDKQRLKKRSVETWVNIIAAAIKAPLSGWVASVVWWDFLADGFVGKEKLLTRFPYDATSTATEQDLSQGLKLVGYTRLMLLQRHLAIEPVIADAGL